MHELARQKATQRAKEQRKKNQKKSVMDNDSKNACGISSQDESGEKR